MNLKSHRLPAGVLGRRELLKLGAGAALAVAAGCGSAGPLRCALESWCGYQFLRLAAREGWLPAEVELVHEADAEACMDALRRGAVEAAAVTLDQALQLLDLGVDVRVALIFDVSVGADVVLARPGIAPADLRGRRIGVQEAPLGVVMLAKFLQAAGLRREDVVEVRLQNDHVRAWRDDALDAIVSYEPWSTRLCALGLVRLFDSRATPQMIFDGLAVRREALSRHRGALKGLIDAHFRAVNLWQTNPIDSAYRLAPYLGVPPEAVAGVYRWLDLPDLESNRHLLENPSGELLPGTLEVARILQAEGVLRSASPRADMFTSDYLPEMRS